VPRPRSGASSRARRGALDALYHLVSWLRKRLAAMGADGALTAASSTYRLDIPAAHVDVHRFRDLVARASELAGDDRRAISLLEEALRLH
jgi:two-component SAPR family response regulator